MPASSLPTTPAIALLTALCATTLPLRPAAALDCKNAVSTPEMVACADAEREVEDKRLNRIYQTLMKLESMDEQARGLLRDAQRKWVQYRDARCSFEADAWRGGTGASLLYVGCLAAATKARADELETDIEQRR
ncbi:DUF1311 domain-containing protein [Azospirillum sp. RWY-5-1]|uniref:DUF1311 domain-containing protein n=1 Tax=Azospirillum oleiclasticum TaxID=2735135 RepID=A0ABX2T8G6_9PROT|nr:DUF1311 domain-containing protein [Azospirillum oleiclasticum]NYZ20624.1 DUF1311 domain-containing protein [Azospirillum oleiclasticum]